jgi:hypothetical protein
MAQDLIWKFRWRWLGGEWVFDRRKFYSRETALQAADRFSDTLHPIITEIMQQPNEKYRAA